MKPNEVFELSPPPTLEALVLERLREAILSGIFEPGGKLNHVQLAAQFGVSRGPIRAALGKLEEEGLVNHVPHRGTFVSTLEQDSMEDLYNIRALLEQYAAQEAVKNATQEDIDQLESLLHSIQRAARDKDNNKVVWSDYSIHKFIIDLSDNYFLKQIWSNLQLHIRWALADRFLKHQNLEAIADTHVALLEKFKQRDAQGAGEIIRSHTIEALEDLKTMWKNSDSEPISFSRKNNEKQ